MNIMYIKQVLKCKVNVRDTEKALKELAAQLLGVKDNETVNMTSILTSDIPGVKGGSKVLLLADEKFNTYVGVSVGASNSDMSCVVSDNLESIQTYSFEYAMVIDKKLFESVDFGNIKESLANTDNELLLEAMQVIGNAATNGRYSNIISGSYGMMKENAVHKVNGQDGNAVAKDRFQGIVAVDFVDKDSKDIQTTVIGRKGKLHMLKIVPILENELEVLKFLDDSVMNELVALSMIKDGKGTFKNRKTSFNFANVLPMEKLTDEDIADCGFKLDKSGKAIITTVEDVSKFLDKM